MSARTGNAMRRAERDNNNSSFSGGTKSRESSRNSPPFLTPSPILVSPLCEAEEAQDRTSPADCRNQDVSRVT